jgi:ketosteroid isomerase-like protein
MVDTPPADVIDVLGAFCDALARRDVNAVVGLLVPGEDVVVVTSEDAVLRDRAQFEAFLKRYANGPTTYTWDWERSTVAVSGQVAWLLAEGVETATSPAGETRTPYRMTMLCQQHHGHWKIAQVHGSSPHHP